MKPIHYEKHPVSAERKAELLAQGVKIVDLRFKPADIAELAEEKPKRRTKRITKQE